MERLNYPVIGVVKSKSTGELYPILDIPLMSDETWNRLASSPEQIKLRNKR